MGCAGVGKGLNEQTRIVETVTQLVFQRGVVHPGNARAAVPEMQLQRKSAPKSSPMVQERDEVGTDAANVNLPKMDAFPNVWEIPFPQ